MGKTHVKLEQNSAMPAILNSTPNRSNFFSVAKLKFSVCACVLGTVQIAAIKKKRYMIANSQKLALHPSNLSAMPENILPITKPTGLPAEKHANARFFLLDWTL